MDGVQMADPKIHVIVMASEMVLDLQAVINVAPDLDLLSVVLGMLVIPRSLVVAMSQTTIMTEILQVEIVMIAEEEQFEAAASTMTTVNEVHHVVVAQHHHDLKVAERNGLDMILQLAKAILKVYQAYLCPISNLLTVFSPQPYIICRWSHVSNLTHMILYYTKVHSSSDHELRNVFEKFGKVQTCIVNKDKRHAFVKMISRAAAMSAKEGMERNRTPDSQLRVC